MKKIVFSLLISSSAWLSAQIVITDNSYKQVLGATKEQLEAVKTRKLAVILQTPNSKRLEEKDIKNSPEIIEKIKKYFDNLNSELKTIVPQYWTYTKNIEFITEEKAIQLCEAGNKEYAVMGFVYNTGVGNVRTYLQYKEIGNQKEKLGVPTSKGDDKDWSYTDGNCKIFVKPIELLKIHTTHFEIPVGDLHPGKADIITGIQCLKLMFEEGKELADVKTNKEIIKSKILLLNKDWMNAKLSEEDIKKAYPHPYKLVDAGEYNQIVASKDKQYCCLASLPHLWNNTKGNSSANNTFETRFMSVVIDLETGKLVNYEDNNEGLFTSVRIGKKVLKNIAD
ncbi:MAG TPA: hypothetical protein VNZ49_10090 [Bacteroidia bacterium]|nr:hypothetical protein [Bacteroidia bacterium]